jgi:hypothetical protein
MGWGNPVQHSMCSMALFPTGDQPAENAPKGVSQFPSRKQLAVGYMHNFQYIIATYF